jgi:hypothetical protein
VRIKVILAAGLTLTAVAVFAVLRQSPLTAAGSNGIPPVAQLGTVQGAGAYCQPGETLPRDISAVRLSFGATTGPTVAVTVSANGHVVTSGQTGAGWYGSAVTVPVRLLHRSYSNVTICARFGVITGDVGALGEQAGEAEPAGDGFVSGRLRIVYLRPSTNSWWSLASSVIDHMALGRAASGTWVAFAIAALIAAAIVLASVAITWELR